MIKFIKQFFCKHIFNTYWESAGVKFFHVDQWYYDDWQVKSCEKCGKEKPFNQY